MRATTDLRGCSDESRGLGVPWIIAARRRLIEPVGQCPGRTLVRGFPVALRVTKPFGHSCYPSFEALIILVFVMLIGRSRDLLHKSLLHTHQTLRRRHEGRRITLRRAGVVEGDVDRPARLLEQADPGWRLSESQGLDELLLLVAESELGPNNPPGRLPVHAGPVEAGQGCLVFLTKPFETG